jgi:hypothetical protein
VLSPDQINTAMGATGMTVSGPNLPGSWYDDSVQVPDRSCLPINDAAEELVYAGSGWSGVRNQELSEPGVSTHTVQQGVVLFSSAQNADAFFTASARQWPACANRQFTKTAAGKPDEVLTVGPVSNTNGTLSATQTAGPISSWAWESCQRALTVTNNVAIDVEACSENQSDSQSNSAVTIAQQIAAKVPT